MTTPPTWPERLEELRAALCDADRAAAEQDMPEFAKHVRDIYGKAIRIAAEVEQMEKRT